MRENMLRLFSAFTELDILQNDQITSFICRTRLLIPRLSHSLTFHYFTIFFFSNLSLKSPGGPPGSFGRNFPTLF